jgi:predicted lysophospholipase L1 biosynthesis ABC-type transport system permease subunit
VTMLLRAGVRLRWRSWLASAFLVALVGGLVLGGVANVRATETAFPRYLSAHGYDAFFYSSGVNFGESVNFPLIFGLVVALFGVATLIHFLVVSVARRRREIGLLKALGFVRRQVALSVSWQATTIVLVGILFGVPVGLALGRVVWRLFAENLGVFPVPVVNGWLILFIALGALVVANLLSIGPAVIAPRSPSATLLRAE